MIGRYFFFFFLLFLVCLIIIIFFAPSPISFVNAAPPDLNFEQILNIDRDSSYRYSISMYRSIKEQTKFQVVISYLL
jgi:hypothetical protein